MVDILRRNFVDVRLYFFRVVSASESPANIAGSITKHVQKTSQDIAQSTRVLCTFTGHVHRLKSCLAFRRIRALGRLQAPLKNDRGRLPWKSATKYGSSTALIFAHPWAGVQAVTALFSRARPALSSLHATHRPSR